MMQTLKRKVRFNYHDYLLLPEDKRYEILDGDLSMVPAPTSIHQQISMNIYNQLYEYLKGKRLGNIFYAPIDVILSDEDIVQPDILFIVKERLAIVKEKNIQAAPDLVIEILSTTNKDRDTNIKKKIYERYGVREYWMVDPEAQSIEVLQMTDDGFKLYRAFPRGTHLKSPLLEGLSFLIDEIFKI